jgi:hypothetical protein
MAEYMTYDEIKLAALLSVSSPTYLINSGKRHNGGKPNHENEAFEVDAMIRQTLNG